MEISTEYIEVATTSNRCDLEEAGNAVFVQLYTPTVFTI
jgi:hypothetical protein